MTIGRPGSAGDQVRRRGGLAAKGVGRVTLPEEALQQLLQPHIGVAVGQIWVIPSQHLNWTSNSAYRWCALLALEDGAGGPPPIRAHFVVGSTKREFDRSVPVVEIPAGEGGLQELTLFAFKMSTPMPLGLLRAEGDYKGTLSMARIEAMLAAIRTSPRSSMITLKRLIHDA